MRLLIFIALCTCWASLFVQEAAANVDLAALVGPEYMAEINKLPQEMILPLLTGAQTGVSQDDWNKAFMENEEILYMLRTDKGQLAMTSLQLTDEELEGIISTAEAYRDAQQTTTTTTTEKTTTTTMKKKSNLATTTCQASATVITAALFATALLIRK